MTFYNSLNSKEDNHDRASYAKCNMGLIFQVHAWLQFVKYENKSR